MREKTRQNKRERREEYTLLHVEQLQLNLFSKDGMKVW